MQTSCRCLREVIPNSDVTALIWLSRSNYDLLDKELKKNHHSSVEQFTKGGKRQKEVKRYSRQEVINLPSLHYYQFDVRYNTITNTHNDEESRLRVVTPQKQTKQLIYESDIKGLNTVSGQSEIYVSTEPVSFNYWLSRISKESFGTIGINQLRKHTKILKEFFGKVSFENEGVTYLDPTYKQQTLRSDIRKCFTPVSTIECKEETIPRDASLLNPTFTPLKIFEKILGVDIL
ncbi:MAG: hypothetical protein NC402_06265 [Prevotella sp.]|nr:hypothetical protein [Prevotella sp.]